MGKETQFMTSLSIPMDNNKNISVSHLSFHQRIINKYQKGKRNPFKFPMMILYKNTRYGAPRKITIDMLLQFHFHIWNSISSSIVKNVHNMKRLFSWFGAEKLKSLYNTNSPTIQKPVGNVSLVRSKQSVFSWPRNISLTLTKVIQRLFPIADAVFHSHIAWDVSAPGFTMNHQLFNYNNNVWKHHFVREHKSNVWKHHFVREHKSLAILPQVTPFLNKSSKETFQNWITVHKPLIQHYYDHPGFDVTNFGAIQRRTTFTTDGEPFYFRKQHKIEQEVEEIKKIVVETKEAVTDNSQASYPPLDVEIKKHLDINHLSDQVYQNIERRIRWEKERRGL